jgi:hypothetical protein
MKISIRIATGLVLLSLLVLTVSGTSLVLAHNMDPDQGNDQESEHDMGQPFSPDHNPPSGINFSMSEMAREMVTERAQFQLHANSSVPGMIWGDKDYEIQNKINIESLVEYTDTNNDGQYSVDELVQILIINESTVWNFTDVASNDTTSVISFYTQEINVSGFESVFINLTYYLNVDSTHMKFDIEIKNWPWISDQNRLAFGFSFAPTRMQEQMQIRQFNDSSNDPTGFNQTAGMYLRNREGQIIGYFMSNNFAFAGNNFSTIDVVTQIEINNDELSANLYLNYAFFDDYLLHDPIIGSSGDTVEGLASTIGEWVSTLISKPGLLGITTILAVVSVSVLVIIRRRI